MAEYKHAEPPANVKDGAEYFAEMCRAHGWDGENEQVHVVVMGGSVEVYRMKVEDGEAVKLDDYKCRDGVWEKEVPNA